MKIVHFVGESIRRYSAIDGYDRGLALATQAFVAVVPLLVLIEGRQPAGRSNGSWLVDWLGLDEDTANAVRALFAHPSEPTNSVTLIGLAILVVSVLGFARTLQRTFEAAWELPRSGFRGYWPGLLGSAAFVGEVIGLALLAHVLEPLPISTVLITVLWAAVGALAWWPVQRLLVGGRVAWRDLVPGAALTGLAQASAMSLSWLYLKPALTSQARRYGEIGVAATLVTVLIALGVLLVAGAVLGPVLAGRRLVRQDTPVEPSSGLAASSPGSTPGNASDPSLGEPPG